MERTFSSFCVKTNERLKSIMKSVLILIAHKFANIIPVNSLRSRVYRLSGLQIGNDVFIGEDVILDRKNPKGVQIGDRTAIGARSIITSHQSIPTGTDLTSIYPSKDFVTVIENDVWIMPNVTVVPGVKIGHHSVIATGVVVHKDVPPYSMVVGNGFRIAKSIKDSL